MSVGSCCLWNVGLFSCFGDISSMLILLWLSCVSILDYLCVFVELIVIVCMLVCLVVVIWLCMSVSSGDMRMVGLVFCCCSSSVVMKYIVDLFQLVCWMMRVWWCFLMSVLIVLYCLLWNLVFGWLMSLCNVVWVVLWVLMGVVEVMFLFCFMLLIFVLLFIVGVKFWVYCVVQCEGMIICEFVVVLRDVGFVWNFVEGDCFQFDLFDEVEFEVEVEVFMVSEMMIEVWQMLSGMDLVFNGMIEWVFDVVMFVDVVWLFWEDQLCEFFCGIFCVLVCLDDIFCVDVEIFGVLVFFEYLDFLEVYGCVFLEFIFCMW